MLWVVPVFPILRKKGQENHQEFEASLDYRVRLSMGERNRNRPVSEPV